MVVYERISSILKGNISKELIPYCITNCHGCVNTVCYTNGFGDMDFFPDVRKKK
jgi:hypothetical protein